jgi:CPA1 family monovalent cation:H+ antiporter
MQRFSKRLLKKKPLEFSNYSLRELLIASFAGVRGAITLAGVLSIPLFLTNGEPFPARYELVFIATGVILFSLLVGVVVLPLLLRGVEGIDKTVHRREVQMARAVMAGTAIESLYKMEERLAADTEENIDPELLKEISSRVVGNLRRRVDGKEDLERALYAENLERRFRLSGLRAERGELYHLRATQQISNETMQKLLHDLDLLETLLIEKEE